MNQGQLPVWATVAMFAIVLSGVLAHFVIDHRRIGKLCRLADKLGFAFSKNDEDSLLEPLRYSTHLFHRGKRKPFPIRNAIYGQSNNLDVFMFDYRYGIGRREHKREQTVFAVQIHGSTVPQFELRPERIRHKAATLVGFDDIDLPDHLEFSKKYLLLGHDEGAVRAMFTRNVVARVMKAKKISIESNGQWIVVYRLHKRLKVRQIEPFLKEALELVSLVV